MTEQPSLKEQGNAFFQKGQYMKAIDCYQDALRLEDTSNEAKAILHGNKAACYLKLDQLDETVDEATKCLEYNPNYMKALFRRCKAREDYHDYESAFQDAQRMVKISPKDKSAREIYDRIKLKHDEFQYKCDSVRNMLYGGEAEKEPVLSIHL